MEKWRSVKSGYFYMVVNEHNQKIADTIRDNGTANLIAQVPEMVELRYEWSDIISRLACIIADSKLNGISENDIDYANAVREMVIPYIGLADE